MNAVEIFAKDERIAYIREYADGWVANAYKWPCPGKLITHYRDGTTRISTYDRKYTCGRGPFWVAFSARNGRLASQY